MTRSCDSDHCDRPISGRCWSPQALPRPGLALAQQPAGDSGGRARAASTRHRRGEGPRDRRPRDRARAHRARREGSRRQGARRRRPRRTPPPPEKDERPHRRERVHGHPPRVHAHQREHAREAGRDDPERAGLAVRHAELARRAVLRQLRHPVLGLRDAVARGRCTAATRKGHLQAEGAFVLRINELTETNIALVGCRHVPRALELEGPDPQGPDPDQPDRVPGVVRPVPARLQLPPVVGWHPGVQAARGRRRRA